MESFGFLTEKTLKEIALYLEGLIKLHFSNLFTLSINN